MRRIAAKTWIVASMAIGLQGCGPGKPLPFTTWAPQPTEAPSALTELGRHAANDAQTYTGRLRFSPTDLDRLEIACGTDLATLPSVLNQPNEYRTRPPFTPSAARTGWQLMGTALGHRLERQLWKHDDLAAIDTFLLGLRLGFAVASGDASDVAAGLPIVDQLRSTLAQHLADFDAATLKKLSDGVMAALSSFPSGPTNAECERKMMLCETQAIQDSYRDDKLLDLETTLQPKGHELLHALETLRERDDGRRVEFFDHLASDADAEADWISSAARQPANKRATEPVFKPSPRRPWQALAHFLFGSGAAMLRQRDLTLARTRLLYLNAIVLFAIKTTGTPPEKLTTHAPSLAQDPYSGEFMRYVVLGKGFRVYSVGEDGLDNGGDSDAALLQPDLLLEYSNH